MSIALDVGSYWLRSLRREGRRLLGRRCRSVCAVLEDSPSGRHLLERSGLPFAQCGTGLLLTGDTAADVARSFGIPLLPLLPQGCAPDDAATRRILDSLVESLLPAPEQNGDVCCLALPGGEAASEPGGELLIHLVSHRGWKPVVLDAGTATVLAEGVRDSFSGLALVFGAASSRITLVHNARPVARACIPRGGDWIDGELARTFGDESPRRPATTFWKESRNASILEPAEAGEEQLQKCYRRLTASVLQETDRLLKSLGSANRLRQPLNVLCAGGPAQAPGFADLVQQQLRQTPLPVEIGSVRVAVSDYTVARGCLIHAELEAGSDDGLMAA